jgi:hypothetical protein
MTDKLPDELAAKVRECSSVIASYWVSAVREDCYDPEDYDPPTLAPNAALTDLVAPLVAERDLALKSEESYADHNDRLRADVERLEAEVDRIADDYQKEAGRCERLEAENAKLRAELEQRVRRPSREALEKLGAYFFRAQTREESSYPWFSSDPADHVKWFADLIESTLDSCGAVRVPTEFQLRDLISEGWIEGSFDTIKAARAVRCALLGVGERGAQ